MLSADNAITHCASTMRRPSDRAALWEHWRRRVAGERLAVSSEPECGRYMAKRDGQWIAVQIDIEQEIENGELVGDERIVAFLQGEKFVDPDKVNAIWLRCAAKPITDEEFKRIMNTPRLTDLTRSVIT